VAALAIDGVDEFRHFLLGHEFIRRGKGHSRRKHFRQDHSSDGCLNEISLDAHLDPRMHL
jgi:hypothetical protein